MPTLGHAGPGHVQPSLKTSEERAPASPGSCAATNALADPLQWGNGSQQRCWAFWPCSGADGWQSSSCPAKGTGNSCRRPRGSLSHPITGHLLSPCASVQTSLAPFMPRCLGMDPVCGGEQAPAVCCSSQPPTSTAGKAPSATAMPGSIFGDKDASRHALTLSSPALHGRATSSRVCRDVGPKAPDPPVHTRATPGDARPKLSSPRAPLQPLTHAWSFPQPQRVTPLSFPWERRLPGSSG